MNIYAYVTHIHTSSRSLFARPGAVMLGETDLSNSLRAILKGRARGRIESLRALEGFNLTYDACMVYYVVCFLYVYIYICSYVYIYKLYVYG